MLEDKNHVQGEPMPEDKNHVQGETSIFLIIHFYSVIILIIREKNGYNKTDFANKVGIFPKN